MIREKDGSAGAGNMPGDPRSASGTPRDNAADIRAQERKSMSGQGKLVYREKKRCPLLLELDSATELSISQQEEDDSMLKELYELIEQLSPIEKSIIYLYLDKNSYKEIGEIIGISPAYVGTRIQRIKQKLRRLHEGRIGHKKRV